jgi:CDP-glucose 4,6-dehydratase
MKKEKVIIRNPKAIRPWQHVVEPLCGYLMLAQKLYEDGQRYAGAWNFGPYDSDARPVVWLVNSLCAQWGPGASYLVDGATDHPHEAHYLKLDCSKAITGLGWRPQWSLEKAVAAVVAWTRTYAAGGNVHEQCLQQISEYLSSAGEVRCD